MENQLQFSSVLITTSRKARFQSEQASFLSDRSLKHCPSYENIKNSQNHIKLHPLPPSIFGMRTFQVCQTVRLSVSMNTCQHADDIQVTGAGQTDRGAVLFVESTDKTSRRISVMFLTGLIHGKRIGQFPLLRMFRFPDTPVKRHFLMRIAVSHRRQNWQNEYCHVFATRHGVRNGKRIYWTLVKLIYK
jgi:hypothetical protein